MRIRNIRERMWDKSLARKNRNLLGTLLLISSLAVTQLPTAAAEANTSVASDFQISGSTLLEYTGTATTVSVPDSVKTIASGAFSGDADLYTVHLPDKLQAIEADAFAGCSTLTVVDFPDSLTTIGDFAFSGCDALRDVQLGKNVKKIGDGAFAACDNLADISFDKDNESFTDYGGALYDKKKTRLHQVYAGSEYTKYTMPDTVKEIRPYAFWGCDKLRFAELNANIREIPANAFANCTGLEELTLPPSVTGIDARAFFGCVNLAEIEIPPSVQNINATAFDGCTRLVIRAQEGSAAKTFDDAREKGDAAAAEYEDTTGQTDTGSRYPIGTADDAQNAGAGNGQSDSGATGQGAAQSSAESGQNGAGAAKQDAALPGGAGSGQNDTGGSGVLGQSSVVGGRAFVFIDNAAEGVYGNAAPMSGRTQGGAADTSAAVRSGGTVQFPDSGGQPDAAANGQGGGQPDAAANGQDGAQSASEPGTAGDGAVNSGVADSTDAKKGGFPKYTVVGDRIAAQAYYKDEALASYQIPEQITQIGDFAFARSGLTSITVPEGVTQIGYGAFYHCDELGEVILPATITQIEPAAFEHTKWLDSWQNGGNTNDYLIVGDGILLAYKGKESKITVPEGIKQIGPQVFKDHRGITGVSLPNSLQTIGEEAFSGCTNLKTVTGGVAVEQIKDRAFYNCPLETIRIPESVREIGLQAYGMDNGGEQRDNAVVFMGDTLPLVSCEKTATRLSNAGYRNPAFEGVPVAIVGANVGSYENTVLDDTLYGFRGLICSVQKEASGGQAGVLNVLSSTLESSAQVPQSVTVYGSTYLFAGDEEAVKSAAAAREESAAQSMQAGVRVLANSSALPADAQVTALLADSSEPCYLILRDSSEAKQAILDACHVLYGAENDPLLYGFDLALYDNTRSVPITRLGNSSVKVQMPLPEGLTGGSIHVVCTDEDGQLEDIEYQAYTLDGRPYVEFDAKHFSPYGIYQYEGAQAAVQNSGAVFTAATRQKDSSPDTGDRLHPKWFLALGLFALSMVAFLGGRRSFPERI